MTVVERSLQCTEILAATSIYSNLSAPVDKNTPEDWRNDIGLIEVSDRKTFQWQNVTISMSVLIPRQDDNTLGRYKPGEVIVAFQDICDERNDLLNTLSFLDIEPVRVNCSGGLGNERLMVHPGVLRLAEQAINSLAEYMHCGNGLCQLPNTENSNSELNYNTTTDLLRNITSIRLVGYSIGGATAAIASMILDGCISMQNDIQCSESDSNRTHRSAYATKQILSIFSGVDSIRCFTIGSPPCVSRGIIPRYVSSVILGDDIVTRTTKESTSHFISNINRHYRSAKSKYLQFGDAIAPGKRKSRETIPRLGKINRQKSRPFGSFSSINQILRPIVSTKRNVDAAIKLGTQGVKRYSEGSVNDIDTLNVPGRVFYLKNRDVQKLCVSKRGAFPKKVIVLHF